MITLTSIKRETYSYEVFFSCSDAERKWFKASSVSFTYPIDVSIIPDAVLAVPFVANVAPLVWLLNTELRVPSLDKDFYHCLPEVKAGYEKMYPGVQFGGQIIVGELLDHRNANSGKCAMFYSGGLDSVDTFVRHCKECPDLISIWGSDIAYDNVKGWELVHTAVEFTAKKYNLSDFQIRSQFRCFLDEDRLTGNLMPTLHDSWWHGVQHGLGLLGHVAPLAWAFGYDRMYIASTFTDYSVTCASSPLTDDKVRYCGCQVHHDGFDCTRQMKIANVVKYSKEQGQAFPLHVCWKTQTGRNCNVCEKCLRTIAGLLAEGEDPELYGFVDWRSRFVSINPKQLIRRALYDDRETGNHAMFWSQISDRLRHVAVKRSGNRKIDGFLMWAEHFDFLDKHNHTMPLELRLKRIYYSFRSRIGSIRRRVFMSK